MTSAKQERVTFSSPDNIELVGIFTTAQPDSKQAVILCHGYMDSKDRFHLPALAEQLSAAGLNSLRFDFSGNAESGGAMRFANYRQEVEEIAAAKLHLEQALGQRVVGLLGHSKGGNDVLLYAASHGDIPLVVNVAARCWMERGITARYGADIMQRLEDGPVTISGRRAGRPFDFQITKQEVEQRIAINMEAEVASIKPAGSSGGSGGVTVLTIHGSEDATISVQDGQRLAELMPGSQLLVVEGADHNFTTPHHAQHMVDAAVTFLRTHAALLGSGSSCSA